MVYGGCHHHQPSEGAEPSGAIWRTTKLDHLQMLTATCSWIKYFLSNQPQSVRLSPHLFPTVTQHWFPRQLLSKSSAVHPVHIQLYMTMSLSHMPLTPLFLGLISWLSWGSVQGRGRYEVADTERHVKGKKHRYTVFKGQLKYYLSKISNMSDSRLFHPCLLLVTIMILKVPLILILMKWHWPWTSLKVDSDIRHLLSTFLLILRLL